MKINVIITVQTLTDNGSSILLRIMITVEPLNKGHFGSAAFVLLLGGCPLVGG